MTISQATKFLEDAFAALNKEYFENTLSTPIITIQSSPRAYGHFTTNKIWKHTHKGAAYHEINISAETLNRPISSTVATLVHEMVHYYCQLNSIQDTSRGGTYHNKRFKGEAEKRGLLIEYDEKIGFSLTQPAPALKSFCSRQGWRNKLTISRGGNFGGNDPKPKKPTSTRKYVCPCCAQSVRATKDVNLICGDCTAAMLPETA